jgi:hypothetical protein
MTTMMEYMVVTMTLIMHHQRRRKRKKLKKKRKLQQQQQQQMMKKIPYHYQVRKKNSISLTLMMTMPLLYPHPISRNIGHNHLTFIDSSWY